MPGVQEQEQLLGGSTFSVPFGIVWQRGEFRTPFDRPHATPPAILRTAIGSAFAPGDRRTIAKKKNVVMNPVEEERDEIVDQLPWRQSTMEA